MTHLLADHPLASRPQGPLLLQRLAAGRLGQALLLEGSDLDGLEELARELAAAIVAKAPPGPVDVPAYGRALRGTHADVHWQRRDKATVISVAALGALLERAWQTPLEGDRQVLIVSPADAMDAQGVARYLKALEEPPAHAVFLLLSTQPERLPDAVLSRCQRLRLPPLEDAHVAGVLTDEGVAPEVATRIAARCSGSLTRARRMAAFEVLEAQSELLACVASEARGMAATLEGIRVRIEAHAKATAEEGEAASFARARVRRALGDLLHAFAVDARQRAAGAGGRLPPHMDAEAALSAVATWGSLEMDLHRNVAERVVLAGLLSSLLPFHRS